MINRRNFIKHLSIGTLSVGFANSLIARSRDIEPIKGNGSSISQNLSQENQRILPPSLKEGSLVAIASPASPVNAWNLTNTVNLLKKNGYKVEIGRIAKNQDNKNRYLAASDEERAKEFMDFFERNDVDAIICARGGYGTMRILDKLDYNLIKSNPKIIVGFSDITALLNAIYAKTNLVCFHGPVGVSKLDEYSLKSMKSVLTENDKLFSVKLDEIKVINEGICEGFIQGGNLRIISSTLGTPYEIQTDDAILFLEDVSEHAYEIDRMLMQLILSRKMKNIRGIVFGKFKNLNVRKSFYPNRGKTILEVINEVCKPLGVPLIYDFPFGHTSSKITLPIGIKARIDTRNKTFELLEAAVC